MGDNDKGVKVTPIKEGDNKNYPKKGDMVTIHYTGRLKSNDVKFDSSIDKGDPFVCKIGVGQVIKGWDEGIPQLSLGEKARLTINSDYGYGEGGFGSVIPSNSDLVFDVELLAINDLKAPK